MASAGGGEWNAIITPRAIINSVSNGDGGRRTVDCCGVLRDHIGGLCLFSGSPHSPVKLFCRRSHCQPHSTEGCRRGDTILLERVWRSCCLLKGFQRYSYWQGCSRTSKYVNLQHTMASFSHAMWSEIHSQCVFHILHCFCICSVFALNVFAVLYL